MLEPLNSCFLSRSLHLLSVKSFSSPFFPLLLLFLFFRVPYNFFVRFISLYFNLFISETKLFSIELEELSFQRKSPGLKREVVND